MNVDWLPLTHPALLFAALFGLVLVAPLAAERVGLPGLIGLLLAGVLVGPHALGLLDREGAVALLGEAGLLYLMFLGGLDLDLEGFAERRRDSGWFGLATFTVPMLVNTGVCLLLGFSPLASVLLASALTSHTLVHYPLIRRLGLSKNRAVTAALGATLPANIGALLVLAIVAAVHRATVELWFWAALVASLTSLILVALLVLPRLTRWFFANLGQDRTVRLVYVLMVMFGVAALAHAMGIEPIVGAFLAGLALNPFVPDGSVLMERLNFLGSVLLVPIFLLATGMLVDPVAVATEPDTALAGVVLAASALFAKWLAAWVVGKPLGFSGAEIAAMFSLTGAQAAGAIAAAVVAFNIGLIGQAAVNAIVIVVLLTLLATAAVAERWVPLIPRPARRAGRLADKIVVPIANPESTEPLVRMASLLANADSGEIVPVNIAAFDVSADEIDERRAITTRAEQVALRGGAEATGLVRVDNSPTAGVLHTVVEHRATAVLLGWKGFATRREHFFGGVIDTVLPKLPVPALLCRVGDDPVIRRVLLSLSRADLGSAGQPSRQLALDVAVRLARAAAARLVVISEAADEQLERWLAEGTVGELIIDDGRLATALRDRAEPGDVVVIGASPLRAGLGHDAERMAEAVPGRTLIVAVPRLHA